MLVLNLQFFGGRGGAASRNSGDNRTLEDKFSHINPGFKKNSGYLDKDGFNNNCVKCAIAFEANMRGDDVQATAFEFGNLEELEKTRNIEKAFGNPDVWEVGRSTKEATAKEITLMMTEDFGEGSRAVIQEQGAGRKHMMNVINDKGKVVVIDSQAGEKGSVSQMLKGKDTKRMTLIRTDNAKLSDEYKKWATKKRK